MKLYYMVHLLMLIHHIYISIFYIFVKHEIIIDSSIHKNDILFGMKGETFN
jgi:hypothetical protein